MLETLKLKLTDDWCHPSYTTIVDQDGFTTIDVSDTAILHNWDDVEGVDHWSASEDTHRDLTREEYGQLVRMITCAPDMLRFLKENQRMWHYKDSQYKEIQSMIDFIEKDPRYDY